MKYLLCVLTVNVFLCSVNYAQNMKSDEARALRDMELIVGLKGYSEYDFEDDIAFRQRVNMLLEDAMQKIWTFSAVDTTLELSEVASIVKSDRSKAAILHKEGNYDYSDEAGAFVNYNERLVIAAPKVIASVKLPRYEGDMSPAIMSYGVMRLSRSLELLAEGRIRKMSDLPGYYKTKGKALANKTLLIPKAFTPNYLDEYLIENAYPYKLEIGTSDKIDQVMMDRDSNYAVVFWVPDFRDGKYINELVVINAENGEIFGKVIGSHIRPTKGLVESQPLIQGRELKNFAKLVD